MDEERRQHLRAASRLLAFVKDLNTLTVQRALTKDVSASGVCLVTEQLLKPGAKLELEIKLPDHGASITLTGEVVWSRLIQAPHSFLDKPTVEAGVRFVSITPDVQKLISLYARLNAPPPGQKEQR